MSEVREFTDFAVSLADAARRETLGRWSAGCAVENKASSGPFDPVTAADREAEAAMRRLIEDAHADHGIFGEELAHKASRSIYSWSLDPIDGTRSYACGLPTWVTLIALMENGTPLIGIIDAPRLDERYVGNCEQAWLDCSGSPNALRTSDCATLAEARLSTTDPYLFERQAAERFGRLRSKVRITRYGHDGYAYARLAAGAVDLVVESGLRPHDYHALIPVVRGAGGVFGDWSGGSDFELGAVIAAATPQLYESAVEIMSGAAP